MDLAKELIQSEEGRSATVYTDTEGFATIGVGCLVDKRSAGAGLCDEAIDAQFAHDSEAAREHAVTLPEFDRCNDVRQAVLISMCFQLGSLADWHGLRGALSMGNYSNAADQMLDSKWHLQTKKRCERAAAMMRSGEWVVFS